MVLDGIVRSGRRVVAVLPGAVREVQRPHRRDDLVAEDRVLGLVVRVPDRDARVVPVVAHPVRVLADHLVRVVGAVRPLGPRRVAGPDEELVLDQQPGFVGDLQPLVRHRADAEAEVVPVHLLRQVDEQLAHPRLVPRQVSRLGVLEEAVQRDVRAAEEVGLAVQVRALRGRVEPELAHPEARGDRVAAGGRVEHVEERILRRPQVRFRDRDRLPDRPRLARGERDRLGPRSTRGVPALPRLHRLDELEGHRVGAPIRELRLDEDLLRRDARRHLHALDHRVVRELQRDLVVDAGRPLQLLEVGPGREGRGQHARVRADADEQRVLALPLQGGRHVEDARREAAGVLAELLPVQPDRGAELGLVDAQRRDRLAGGGGERPPVPEVVALLPAHPGGRDARGLGQELLGDLVVDQLEAVEGVHVREGGNRIVHEPGHRHGRAEDRRRRLGRDAVRDLPGAVERQRDPLGARGARGEGEEQEGEGHGFRRGFHSATLVGQERARAHEPAAHGSKPGHRCATRAGSETHCTASGSRANVW